MRRVLVLGISGFMGQYLSRELLRRGVQVTGYDREKPAGNEPVNFIQGDFIRETRFPALLDEGRFDTVYHLISTTVPVPGTANMSREIEENILPTVRLLDAMKTTEAEMIFVSSGGTVYGESQGFPRSHLDPLQPICSYGIQKAVIEQILGLYGSAGEVRSKICRISNPYGVMPQKDRTQGIIPILLRRLLDGEPITIFGETVRDYVYISDVVEALIATADYTGDKTVFQIGSGVGTGLQDLVRLLEERSGLRFASVDMQPIRACDVQENVLDISDTVRTLGWTPLISLADGVDQTLEVLRTASKRTE